MESFAGNKTGCEYSRALAKEVILFGIPGRDETYFIIEEPLCFFVLSF